MKQVFTNLRPKDIIDAISNDFDSFALQLFQYQFLNNRVYNSFVTHLGVDPSKVDRLEKIPFLPIEFFKTQEVVTGSFTPEIIYTSSATTGSIPSRHLVANNNLYLEMAQKGFELFYGSVADYTHLALLPSYLEREGSSLITMTQHFMDLSKDTDAGFYLHDHEALYHKLLLLKKMNKKTILWGVTFGLLDFIANYQLDFPELLIIETGGMKGRKKELLREEVHAELKEGFGLNVIGSEYGMTELLSQAYALKDGIFSCPPWMRIFLRDPYDPLSIGYQQGAISVIDLANIHSCAFIATQDLGKLHDNNSFEILGRMDYSDVRGCNLMVS